MSSQTRQSVQVAPLPPATAALPVGRGAQSPGARVDVPGSPRDASVPGRGENASVASEFVRRSQSTGSGPSPTRS